jgi:hypothetical protein
MRPNVKHEVLIFMAHDSYPLDVDLRMSTLQQLDVVLENVDLKSCAWIYKMPIQ